MESALSGSAARRSSSRGQGFDSKGMYVGPGAVPGEQPGTYWFYYTGVFDPARRQPAANRCIAKAASGDSCCVSATERKSRGASSQIRVHPCRPAFPVPVQRILTTETPEGQAPNVGYGWDEKTRIT